ncbi:sulfite reductase, ferredoxin dependent [Cyanobium gracile]|uniref:assimilatory sulfite reductase (ferredoxin) n=1 Tax=Cyanobium gracile (strain ATCC 27147 / PCC 6307) TaxID=292564 RepID=K9P2R5_CYAGP|nr:sulfite reductase, ferredoxin dependent [Cyanobium gracile]AFY27692.1 ferredoxin-sulfite reductase [Cyanobium gracile PCC 6307]
MSSTTVADSTSLPSAPPAKPPTKQEALKAGSGHLHDPLAAELGNELPSFTDPAVQILKFHGSYQQDDRDKRRKGADKDWQMMLRLRNPGGRIPTSLYLALDSLADRLGNGTLRITTRQAFQMHGVQKTDLKEVIGGIVRALGSTLSACGDINRNVMAPAAPFERDGYPEARLLADQIADLLAPQAAEGSYLDLWVDGDLSYRIKPKGPVKKARRLQESSAVFSGDAAEPLYGSTYLPRKFKVAVTVPGDNSVDLLTQDIGLVLFSDPSGRPLGCNVYVGGGMGRTHNKEETFARTADPLGYVAAGHVLELVQAIVALQRDHGDREQRRHARMKYLIHDRGVDWFRSELGRYFPHPIKGMRREPPAVLTDYLGWHRQSPGLWFVGLPVLCGRLQGELKSGLRRLVKTYQLEVRLTPNQDLLLCNIGSAQRASVREGLAALGLSAPEAPAPLARHALACPALPLCGLAITEAERILPSVLERLEALLERLEISKPLLVRMTGCPNGCARPYMAEIGLVGSAVDTYQLWLGGSHGLSRLASPYLEKMPLEKLEATLEPLLVAWRDEGGPRSRFGDFVERIGTERVTHLLAAA